MIIEKRQLPRLAPKPAVQTVPVCKINQIGPYGLYFAYSRYDHRPAPGTNYLYAWLHWCQKYLGAAK